VATRRSAPRPESAGRALERELLRVLERVEKAADALVRSPDPPAALLHELHRLGRRLGVLLRVWALVLPPGAADELRPLARRLKRLTRIVGQVRDRDVILTLVGSAGPAGTSDHELREAHRFLSRVRDEASTGRELLRVHLRTEADGGLFRSLRELARRPGRRREISRLRPKLVAELSDRRRQVRRAHRKARRRPTPVRLHGLRIRLRRLRHLQELTDSLGVTSSTGVPAALRRLQDRLGRIHDLDLALAALGPTLRRSAWTRELRELRRDERARAERTIARLERLLLPEPKAAGPPAAP
jgi:CHAD domain-containing protein